MLSACHKYEDGPIFSLKTKKNRVSQSWVLDQAFKNESDTITTSIHLSVTFKKDGDVTYVDTVYTNENIMEQRVRQGAWQFTNNDAAITMVIQNPDGTADAKYWYILRLATDQLWVREQVGNDYYQYNFKVQ